MPRSKLGLKLTLEKLCQKEKFNPTLELIKELKAIGDDGKPLIRGRERIAALTVLINKLKATPKPQETVPEGNRKITIIRQMFEEEESAPISEDSSAV